MRFLVTCLIVLLSIVSGLEVTALEVESVARSIVRVRAYENSQVRVEGSGFVVNDTGHVLTQAHLVKGADRVTVVSLETGAELLAQQTFIDRAMNLAVLAVPGSGLPPLILSEQGAEVGRIVQTLRLTTENQVRLAQGTVSAYQDLPDRKLDKVTVHMLQHNAMITIVEFGMPLFNECDQVVALNVPDPDAIDRLFRRVTDPEDVVFALRAGDIIARLSAWDISHTVVDEVCLSSVARAELSAKEKEEQARAAEEAKQQAEAEKQAAEEAKQQAEAEKQAAEEAKQQAEAEKQAAEEAKQQAEAEKQAAEEAKQQAEAEKQAAEEAKQQAESEKQAAEETLRLKQQEVEAVEEARLEAEQSAKLKEAEVETARQQHEETSQKFILGAIVGSALVILTLLGWFLSSSRKKRRLADAAARLHEAEQEADAARQAAANAPQPAPFKCLLEGQDDSGQQFALSIPALALGDPGGVTIGRNPDNAEFIINHGAISREHIKVTCIEGDLQVEDLATTNGTRVNGRQLIPGVSSPLRDHDQLELGPLRLTVRLL